jgi:hypothetical protein
MTELTRKLLELDARLAKKRRAAQDAAERTRREADAKAAAVLAEAQAAFARERERASEALRERLRTWRERAEGERTEREKTFRETFDLQGNAEALLREAEAKVCR